MKGIMKLSIIIPVFNEKSTIAGLLDKLLAVKFPFETEIIVVDDGSTDGSARILQEYGQENIIKKHCSLINLGKGAAVRFGLEYAEGDYIIIQDADLELDPNDILKIVEQAQKEGIDVVYGSRFLETENAKGKLSSFAANRIMTGYTNVLYGSRLSDMATCYKLVKADLLKNLKLTCIGFELEPELTAKLLRLGHKIKEVPVSYFPRTTHEGKKIRWWDGFKYMYYLTKYRVMKKNTFVKKK